MGTTLREMIYGIGGGVARNRPFKAVQTGGSSGGCLPESMLDTPVDFDSLDQAGSMMGSGGMIVMDDRTCMVDIARYFIDFLVEESCGKCVPCREGLLKNADDPARSYRRHGAGGDTEALKELAESISDTALCALGQFAANPVLSTIRYFAMNMPSTKRNTSAGLECAQGCSGNDRRRQVHKLRPLLKELSGKYYRTVWQRKVPH